MNCATGLLLMLLNTTPSTSAATVTLLYSEMESCRPRPCL